MLAFCLVIVHPEKKVVSPLKLLLREWMKQNCKDTQTIYQWSIPSLWWVLALPPIFCVSYHACVHVMNVFALSVNTAQPFFLLPERSSLGWCCAVGVSSSSQDVKERPPGHWWGCYPQGAQCRGAGPARVRAAGDGPWGKEHIAH